MQKFSVNTPGVRQYLNEKLISDWWRELGGIALRCDVADVYINGEYKGVYLTEEHPEKRAVEHSKKREAPVIERDILIDLESAEIYPREVPVWGVAANAGTRKTDDFFWNYTAVTTKKTLESDTLHKWAAYAISQLNMLQLGRVEPSLVFDYEAYSKFYVLVDIFNAMHGAGSITNTHAYFNPVTALLEPIPGDMQSGWDSRDFAAYGFDNKGRAKLTT
jgi:hypothetical protein